MASYLWKCVVEKCKIQAQSYHQNFFSDENKENKETNNHQKDIRKKQKGITEWVKSWRGINKSNNIKTGNTVFKDSPVTLPTESNLKWEQRFYLVIIHLEGNHD